MVTKTVVDTNILISLLNKDDPNNQRAVELLGKLNQEGGLFINTVVYSELAVYFDSRQELDSFLEDTGIRFEALKKEASQLAGEKFSEYLENRGENLQCPRCGTENQLKCRKCETTLSWRQHVNPDFLIGSHASQQADQLASLDTGFHREYFPELEVVS